MKNTATSLMILFAFLMSCESGNENGYVKSEKCALDPDPGLCKALIPRYYFDRAEGKCKEFNWGGCAGIVPFDTMEECELCECTSG